MLKATDCTQKLEIVRKANLPQNCQIYKIKFRDSKKLNEQLKLTRSCINKSQLNRPPLSFNNLFGHA